MNDRQIERILEHMVAEVPAELTRMGFNRKTCILHTRYAVDALRSVGVRARPLAARVTIGNASWAQLGAQLGHWPEREDWTDETWCVGIGYGPDPRDERPGYDAHVFTVVNERWGLDLTLDQASRPQHNIDLSPHYWRTTPKFLSGDEPAAFFNSDGSVVVYDAMPEDRGFLLAPDWRVTPKIDGYSERLASSLRAVVA
jgi:hypothetical protein